MTTANDVRPEDVIKLTHESAMRLIEERVRALGEAFGGDYSVELAIRDSRTTPASGFTVAWRRDDKAYGVSYVTHRAYIGGDGEAHLEMGHYDIKTRDDAINDALQRLGR